MGKRQPSLENIKKAYLQAAHIVANHGDEYLPLFERVERDHKEQSKQNELLTKAIAVSKSNSIS